MRNKSVGMWMKNVITVAALWLLLPLSALATYSLLSQPTFVNVAPSAVYIVTSGVVLFIVFSLACRIRRLFFNLQRLS